MNLRLTTCLLTGCGFAAALTTPGQATILANWTFETNTPADITDNGTGPSVTSEGGLFAGTSIATGLHASASTDWTTPAGNGSANGLSSNNWAVGDYYRFATSTTGFSAITLAWDQRGSATGPRDFTLQYSTDGTSFTNFMAYTVLVDGWSAGTPITTTSYTANLSTITALDNATSIFLRLIVTSTTSVGGGTVGTAGTGAIDNVVIEGTAIPAPGAIVLLGLAGVIGRARRRR